MHKTRNKDGISYSSMRGRIVCIMNIHSHIYQSWPLTPFDYLWWLLWFKVIYTTKLHGTLFIPFCNVSHWIRFLFSALANSYSFHYFWQCCRHLWHIEYRNMNKKTNVHSIIIFWMHRFFNCMKWYSFSDEHYSPIEVLQM